VRRIAKALGVRAIECNLKNIGTITIGITVVTGTSGCHDFHQPVPKTGATKDPVTETAALSNFAGDSNGLPRPAQDGAHTTG
jgi:hypothetical protein